MIYRMVVKLRKGEKRKTWDFKTRYIHGLRNYLNYLFYSVFYCKLLGWRISEIGVNLLSVVVRLRADEGLRSQGVKIKLLKR